MRSFARDAHAVRIVVGLLTLTLEIHQINSQTRGNPDDELRGPIFLSEPPEHVIIPNTEGAVIPCTVYGNPAPLVTWVTEEGAEVEFDPNVVEVLHNNSLYFHKFSAGDVRASVHTHTYRCMAQNRIGRVISRKVHTKVGIKKGADGSFVCESNISLHVMGNGGTFQS
ncbi:cell adhesion molecule Dscam2-like [Dreissena polymorpha]|uniref:cell adhesion molecule Dscam2-like n=1 Tax=Dreissena polymorpha TaxID=45954 RepID=UPI0022642EFA|nr:cell adhesion molecule Dscam2-like [Dreissena polymorpha]